SFTSWCQSWPVCARCTGIYVGAALAAISALTIWRREEKSFAVECEQPGAQKHGLRTHLRQVTEDECPNRSRHPSRN
ncbi:MAG: DUF2085 domain-containing protein, partial [Microcoleus sp. SIO2G3]|nr:DUF2085 domain-containing protein [Microcoleus sp. SIO2G3]